MLNAREFTLIPLYQEVKSTNSFMSNRIGFPARQVNLDEYIDIIFGRRNTENLCFFNLKNKQNIFYPADCRSKIGHFVKTYSDAHTYLSGSTYFRTGQKLKSEKMRLRTQSNIVHTYLLYQDLDYYKLNMSQSEVLNQLATMIRKGLLICPSFFNFSGQGLQLIWKMQRFKNKAGLTNDLDFKMIQEYMYKLLEDFNPDSVVKNPSCVHRLVDGIHQTTKEVVTSYYTNQEVLTLKDMVFYYGLTPTPDRIVRPKSTAPLKLVPSVKEIREPIYYDGTNANEYISHLKDWNNRTLNGYRSLDIFTYVDEMKRKGISIIGKRHWLCLVLRFHVLVYSDGDKILAQKAVNKLMRRIDMTGTSPTELNRRSIPAERYFQEWKDGTWDKTKYKRGGLFYTNARMLDLMDITTDYEIQWKMRTIKIKNKKYDAVRKHQERLQSGKIKGSMAEYNGKRKSDKEKNFEKIQNVLAANPKMKQQEIADKVGVSLSYCKEIIREIKKK